MSRGRSSVQGHRGGQEVLQLQELQEAGHGAHQASSGRSPKQLRNAVTF